MLVFIGFHGAYTGALWVLLDRYPSLCTSDVCMSHWPAQAWNHLRPVLPSCRP